MGFIVVKAALLHGQLLVGGGRHPLQPVTSFFIVNRASVRMVLSHSRTVAVLQ